MKKQIVALFSKNIVVEYFRRSETTLRIQLMEPIVNQKKRTEEKEASDRKITVLRQGDKIILPDDMSYEDAHEHLSRQEQEENTVVAINEEVNCFPLDGAVALAEVLKERFGWTNLTPTPGFFSDRPPSLIGVEVGYQTTVQIPWGRMIVPKIDGYIQTHFKIKDGMPIFVMIGEVKRKHEKYLSEIAKDVRIRAETHSIYKGKTVKIGFRDSSGCRIEKFDVAFAPKFLDTKIRNKQAAVYSKSIEKSIEINLLNPIQHSDKCRNFEIPLKRGVLLGGPFGTGKTLAAWKTAKVCSENGWTFLYVEDVRDLDLAMGFAKLYSPCVLFAEDVDRAVGMERDSEIDRILNTLDGVDSKNTEIITVLTTNKLEDINAAFLRPGRMDTVIEVTPPDNEALVRMVRMYGVDRSGRNMIDATDEQLMVAVECLVGSNAAFVREVVERSKLAAISDSTSELKIDADAIKATAESMLPHIRLINPSHHGGIAKPEEEINPMNVFKDAIAEGVSAIVIQKLLGEKMMEKVVEKGVEKYVENHS